MPRLDFKPGFDSYGQALPWLNAVNNVSGVYLIRNAHSKELFYVGESHTGRLGETCKRHFRQWHDTADRQHHTYKRSVCEIAIRPTPKNRAVAAQNALIARLRPRDNILGQADPEPF